MQDAWVCIQAWVFVSHAKAPYDAARMDNAKAWFIVSHAKAPYDVARMDQYLQLTFADTLANAKLHVPTRDGKPDSGGSRKLAADFDIVGRLQKQLDLEHSEERHDQRCHQIH